MLVHFVTYNLEIYASRVVDKAFILTRDEELLSWQGEEPREGWDVSRTDQVLLSVAGS